MLFDKRVEYNNLRKVPFSSSYFCYGILPKQIIFEKITIDKNSVSRMTNDLAEIFG